MGSITETATSAPGNSSLRPNTKAPLAMTLKLNGYSTAQFGKCHEVPVWQSSPLGPFDAWPSGGGGFETFYGFIGGENNQWDPALYDGTTPVEPPGTPEEGYHLTEDLADRAISWVHQQKALMPDKPFFVYFAPGATHAPHHVPKDWRSLQGRVRRRLGRAAARQMEVYAGFLEHTDYYIGRLIDAIEDLGILENTAWRASRTGRSRSRQRSSDPVAARKV
jgi:arylsulfatase A-like enzyme